MKKIILLHLLVSFVFCTQIFAQSDTAQKGWPSVERYSFIRECVREAKKNMSEDSARFYCYCMQEKVEAKYPTVEAASKVTEEDMNSEAWQKDIRGCLGGTWGTEEREAFISSCIESAIKGGISEEKSKNYCECMIFKIEKKYPNSADAAGNLTPEKLNSPEWKKIIQGCLSF